MKMEIVIEVLTKMGWGIIIFGGGTLLFQLIGLAIDPSIRQIYRRLAIRLRKRVAIFIMKKIYREECE